MEREQTRGREKNGAMPGGRPDETTPEEDIIRTGRRSAEAAGPDGPDAGVIGETFKSRPGQSGPSDRKAEEK